MFFYAVQNKGVKKIANPSSERQNARRRSDDSRSPAYQSVNKHYLQGVVSSERTLQYKEYLRHLVGPLLE